MIEVEVDMGRGDRQLKTIRDSLIRTEEMALERARQELAKSMTIIKGRTLALHKIIEINPGDEATFSLSRLEIAGIHRVSTTTLNITDRVATMTMVVEQYGSTP